MRLESIADAGPGLRRLLEEQYPDLEPGKRRSVWRATPTTVDGIRFRSATQARVYVRVKGDLQPGDRLMLDRKLPLPSIAPAVSRKVPTLEVDFVVWRLDGDRWRIARLVDAKPAKWRSRDWYRGKLACEASYGVRVEEAEC